MAGLFQEFNQAEASVTPEFLRAELERAQQEEEAQARKDAQMSQNLLGGAGLYNEVTTSMDVSPISDALRGWGAGAETAGADSAASMAAADAAAGTSTGALGAYGAAPAVPAAVSTPAAIAASNAAAGTSAGALGAGVGAAGAAGAAPAAAGAAGAAGAGGAGVLSAMGPVGWGLLAAMALRGIL